MSIDMPERSSRRQSGRSPAYPAISLPKALQRVRELYDRDKRYPIPVSNVPAVWSYKSLNGPASQVLSSLRQFGLIEDQGTKADRVITVTALAEDILRHPSTDAQEAAIKSAALRPLIHQEMWDAYGAQLPSDANLLWRLVRERGFTETGAKEFARQWRETMSFADLGEQDASDAHRDHAPFEEVSPVNSEDASLSESVETTAPSGGGSGQVAWNPMVTMLGRAVAAPAGTPAAVAGEPLTAALVQSYPIPIALAGRPPVMISGAFPLSETEWAQFTAVLNAMKPVLVGNPVSTQGDPETNA